MKKIINRKMYNTETAVSLADYSNRLSRSDFGYIHETLFQKRTTGEYFLFGEGGAATKYAESFGNARCEGWNITPMTEDQAATWVERYANDRFEDIFGIVCE